MTHDSKKDKSSCPHWSSQDNRCTLCNNGLFIPLAGHVTEYCTSQQYTKCDQLKTEKQHEEKELQGRLVNRRRHKRMPCTDTITVARIITDEASEACDDNIKVIDLSSSGMKVHLDNPLFPNAILQFSFSQADAKGPFLPCLARVKWCSYKKDLSGYAAGLLFEGHPTLQAADNKLSGVSATENQQTH